MKIDVVGLGPGSREHLTLLTIEKMKEGDRVFLRTAKHPVVNELKALGIQEFESFDYLYEKKQTFDEVYSSIVDKLLSETEKYRKIVYAVPGNPFVAETSVEVLIQRGREMGVEINVFPALSFLDAVFTSLGLDPNKGLYVLDALTLDAGKIDTRCHNLIIQVYDRLTASQVKLLLMEFYPHDFGITLIRGAGIEGLEKIEKIPLFELDRKGWIDHLTSVYIPPAPLKNKVRFDIKDLEEIMDLLRGENGCPWDLKQTHHSLKPFLIEETYEVLEMIDEGDMVRLCEELGDLLLQIVFHARIGKEKGEFEMADVITKVSEKMIRRHTHIFGHVKADTPDEVLKNWEEIKRNEKGIQRYTDSLKAIPKNLPALMRAYKVQEKAAMVGFDWERVEDAEKKVFEEIEELKDVYKSGDRGKIKEEMGDVLFAVVNVARFLDVDPEEALRGTIEKFIDRFSYIEECARKANKDLKDMPLEEMDGLWNQIKSLGLKDKK
jgi:tetrapyrrole methylase family protein/MazG family protein